MRYLIKLILWLGTMFVLYFGGFLLYGTLTDWVPEPVVRLEVVGEASDRKIIEDSTLSLLIWNVGYGGLGQEEAFFYDQGHFFWAQPGTVRVPQERVEQYVDGMERSMSTMAADFYLLQEVDTSSRRSWYTHQLDSMHVRLPGYEAYFAMNYKNERVPIPVFQFWDHYGYVRGGLVSFNRYAATESHRYQLPGDLDWPTRLFELDRCVLRQVFPTAWGKDLVIYNIHLAAYDEGGRVKKQQMAWLQEAMIADFAAGAYVIIGGDWNQVPPGFDYAHYNPNQRDEFEQISIATDFAPPGWQWVYDPSTPTNRKMKTVYDQEASLKSLIDFYLVSPNIRLLEVEGIDQDFAYADHQPVKMRVYLE